MSLCIQFASLLIPLLILRAEWTNAAGGGFSDSALSENERAEIRNVKQFFYYNYLQLEYL